MGQMDVPVVTQEMGKWRSAIQNEVKAIRERRRNSERDVRPTKRIKICDNRSDLLHMEGVIQDVKAKYALDEDQSRAYDIFLNHLKSVEYGPSNYLDESDNRCMYLGGAGGTGKSRVIRAIIEAFRVLGKSEKLLVSATTGASAQIINGSTIDALCKFNRTRKGDNREGGYGDNGGLLNTENYWMGCQFLIIDEVSMLGCHKLRRISKALRRFKGNALPFGGLFVLFGGDFQQLKPVKDRRLFVEPLMKYGTTSKKRIDEYNRAYEGYLLWKGVTSRTVVLMRHYRAPDPSVSTVLDRIGRGEITFEDREVLRRRVFGHREGPDLGDKQWRNAILVTPRNAVRQAWNNNAALRHVQDTGNQIFISPSQDEGIRCKRHDMVWTVDSKTEFLATWAVLCIEGPALVAANIAVELGMANGTEVIIKAVVPHEDDEQGWQNIRKPIVKLSRPPICVFVEAINGDKNMTEYYPGRPGWFPVFPITEEMATPSEFNAEEKTFVRTQIPLSPGFAASDYRVQGRGMQRKFILDLRRPPTGRLDLQNIYVMLSRMAKWEDLAILRPYQEDIFDVPPDPHYLNYDRYLKEQDRHTKVQFLRTNLSFMQTM